MPKFNKPCPNCSAKVHVQQRVCKVCHTKLPLGWCKQELPTKGRPKHTNKASGTTLIKAELSHYSGKWVQSREECSQATFLQGSQTCDVSNV